MTGDADTIDYESVAAKLRIDRDRYVAFAFAGSDILLELNAEGVIIFATGALGMLDTTENDATGVAISEFVDFDDRPYAAQFFSSAEPEGRAQMKLLRLRSGAGGVVPFVASCCRLGDFVQGSGRKCCAQRRPCRIGADIDNSVAAYNTVAVAAINIETSKLHRCSVSSF